MERTVIHRRAGGAGGTTRKAIRLYEAAGILPPARRTASGYRSYGAEALRLLEFVRRAQRLGFTLVEIGEIVRIKRAGRAPCLHVHDLVRRKADELDQRLHDLEEVRDGLRQLLKRWRSASKGGAAVCPQHRKHKARMTNEQRENVSVPGLTACPEVEIVRDEVRIGETGNLAVLKKDEWNVFVELILRGDLVRL